MELLLFIGAVAIVGAFTWVKNENWQLRGEVETLRGEVGALRTYITQLWQFLEDERRAAASGATPKQDAAPPAETLAVQPSSEAERRDEQLRGGEDVEPIPDAPPTHTSKPELTSWPNDPYATPPVETPATPNNVAARESSAEERAATTSAPIRGLFNLDWEDLVGVRLFSGIAGIALVLAALFFLKYSVERGWLGPSVRAGIGLASGIALLVVCELKIARGYRITANAMHGAGIAILYATLYAIHAVWHLAPAAVVFALMLVVTAVAVLLSIRRDSVFIAILGLLGGFATPALLSSGENRPLVLFSYLMLLNVGLSWVAYQKRWPALTFGSLTLTVLYQWAWVDEFLDATQFPLAAAIFVVFALIASYALWSDRASADDSAQRRFERIALTGIVLPLAFGLFSAAVPAYGARFHTLFAFLLLVCGGLAVVAMLRNHEWLHTLGGASAFGAFALWSVISYTPAAWPEILGWLAAFVLLYLAVATRREWVGNFTVPALLAIFSLLAIVESRAAGGWLFFGSLLILLAASAFVAVRWRRSAQYVAAIAIAVVVQMVWTLRHLQPSTTTAALAAYGGFALLVIAVSLLLHRLQRRAANAIYFAFAPHLFLIGAVLIPLFDTQPWRLLVTLSAIAVPAAAAALVLRRAEVMIVAVAATQGVLFTWATRLNEPTWQVTAFIATVAVAALAMVSIRMSRRQHGFVIATFVALLSAHVVAMTAAVDGHHRILGPLLLTHLILVAATAILAARERLHSLLVVSAVVTSFALLLAPTEAAGLPWRLAFAAGIWGVYVLHSLATAGRVGKSMMPALAVVIAGAACFLAARAAIDDTGYASVIGLLPLTQAAVMGAVLFRILRTESAETRDLTRLALVAGATLAFITVAVPLQLERQWVNIAWALEGAALVWLYRRIAHSGLLVWAGALLAIVFVRLAMNQAILDHAPSSIIVFNWYLYTYLATAAAFFAAARWLPAELSKGRRAAAAGGTILLFVLLNIEIADFYSPVGAERIRFASSSLAQDLTYTMGWAGFAMAMLIAGIVLSSRSARIAALALLSVTIFKCFLHDLGNLEGLYRVASLLGLAFSLVAVGVLIQRFVITPTRRNPEPA